MLYIRYFLIFLIQYAGAKVFYSNNDSEKSLPISIGGHINRFQSQILRLLGIKKPVLDADIGKKFASRYMSMLYKKISQPDDEVYFNPNFSQHNDDGFDFNYRKIKAESQASDTIVSFVPKKILKSKNSLNAYILQFNLLLSDFKILQTLSVELYFILESSEEYSPMKSLEVTVKNSEKSHLFLIQLDEFSSSAGLAFFSLNITNFFDCWLFSPRAVQKLLIEFTNINGQNHTIKLPELHCFGVGFFVEGKNNIMRRVKRSFSFEIEEHWSDDDKDENSDFNLTNSTIHSKMESLAFKTETVLPFIVGKEKNDFLDKKKTFIASHSEPESLLPITAPPKLLGLAEDRSLLKFNAAKALHEIAGCRCKLHSLYVDFKDLGWNNWVIAPTGYQADFCGGDCVFPLDNSLSPTNHAIVQTLAHLFNEQRVEPAKCSPTEMKYQNLLFFNEQKNLVMRRYQNMRVKRCGCR